jgi:hypothetical protein
MRAFSEFVVSPVKTASKGKTGRYRAKVSQADAVNLNGRVYPRTVLQKNIERLKPLMAQGRLGGAVDHASYVDAGALRREAILWRDLHMEADGAVIGEFELVPTTSGKDLQQLIDAGRTPGFSTFGHGSCRPCTPEERRRFGVAKDDDEVVVMGDDYRMTAIDAVSDPSVTDALLFRESRERNYQPKPAEKLTGIAAEIAALCNVASCPPAQPAALEVARSRLRTMRLASEVDRRVLRAAELWLERPSSKADSTPADQADAVLNEALEWGHEAVKAIDAERAEPAVLSAFAG